ncbi:MAG: hypothetical protein HY517_02270 [Candidatus Aenigmarchaeota archaeon]|nr:hypothetical protein [Candidatus Aenigmarchaeota archaeon]
MARNYWYVIRIDGKEVWRGKKMKGIYWDFKKKNPDSRVSIAWETDDDITFPGFSLI